MIKHFEELWEQCESFHKDNKDNSINSILEELLMKINLYKMVNEFKAMPVEDLQKTKSRTIGEILLTLTNLSYKDNINVFDSLHSVLKERQLEINIPKDLRFPKQLD